MVWLLDFHNDKETKPTHEFSTPDPHDLIPLRKLTAMLCYTQHNILCMTHQFVFHTTFRFYRGRWQRIRLKLKGYELFVLLFCWIVCCFWRCFVFVVVIIVRLIVWTWVWLQPWPNSNDLPSQSHKNNKYNNDSSNNNNNSDNNNNHHYHIMMMIIIYYKAQIT